MDHWNFIETSTSGQPILREAEKDILLDHNVGLYHGKSKILHRQNGRIFLTSQRIIYVDNNDPINNSLALELDDIGSIEYQSKFLKRSARMIVFFKDADVILHLSKLKRENSSKKDILTEWICPICMFANEYEGEFTEATITPPVCTNCGVPADYELSKSSIKISSISTSSKRLVKKSGGENDNICPACTFINHSELRNCEICGTRLPKAKKIRGNFNSRKNKKFQLLLENVSSGNTDLKEVNYAQFSFRNSDGILFSEATEMALDNLSKARNTEIFNKDLVSVNGMSIKSPVMKELPYIETKLSRTGISTLEQSRETQLARNDILLNNALSDLSNLMSFADDIEKLYSRYNKNDISSSKMNSKQVPSLIVDRDKFYNKNIFIEEIAREIYEFATSEFKDEQQREGCVMISLVDLYAMYNKAMRIGVGFVSPLEMREACESFERLGLTKLKLTKINQRILCLGSDNALEIIKTKIVQIIEQFPGSHLLQISKKLNEYSQSDWTIGVITEVLQNCIDSGILVVDEQLTGILYYKNLFWHI
ncbi:hypothetical protein TBLA_0G02040 [Henningerozyma blattae CBS 6284]|uniref:Vacuolar protein-sorting-associated protein 36 n=1 Tax=Henningerozyma blattae (strain ATCC 34711 / CBS 6284 / DSM 70876 / NBRC 10599 / NRRL Y-10934 / UCD 77-7) TaxID=1071380 RepID=I2H6Z4_HENB6|nr:hypothetical protein TBLA_0G02040 [Tetrapisispora blattae CBS 6284]CCH62146.1 hypothetical protein TBLA_0G02040 [Tetrapisispora blattae CBS 6284]